MKKFLASVLIVVATAFTACAPATSHLRSNQKPYVFDENSVESLQTSDGRTFCTAFSINKEKGLWATAQHCTAFAMQKDVQMTIEGQNVFTVYVDIFHDIAVVQGDVHEQAIRIADAAPGIGRELVEIKGYPYGLPKRVTTQGHLAATGVPLLHPLFNMVLLNDLYDITVAGGNSGSPILVNGRLVGILWGAFTGSNHSIGVPFDEVRRALSQFAN